jgi:hypothetical protein
MSKKQIRSVIIASNTSSTELIDSGVECVTLDAVVSVICSMSSCA